MDEIIDDLNPNHKKEEIHIGDMVITVRELYPYQYDFGKGRTVIRFKIDDPDGTISYDEVIAPLKNNKDNIEYYVDGIHKTTYEGFTDAYNFICYINNNTYEIELAQKSKLEMDINFIKMAILELSIDTATIEESINNKEEV